MRLGKAFKAFSNVRNPSEWLMEAFGVKKSKTGVSVTVNSALGLAPVTYAVNKIRGHMAQLTIDICQSNADGPRPK